MKFEYHRKAKQDFEEQERTDYLNRKFLNYMPMGKDYIQNNSFLRRKESTQANLESKLRRENADKG